MKATQTTSVAYLKEYYKDDPEITAKLEALDVKQSQLLITLLNDEDFVEQWIGFHARGKAITDSTEEEIARGLLNKLISLDENWQNPFLLSENKREILQLLEEENFEVTIYQD